MLEWINKAIDEDINPNAPDYENNIRTKFKGFNVAFQFPTNNSSKNSISFPAYVKKVSDTFTPSFEDKRVYGRMDPIPVYQNTTRQIQFDLDIPSNGLAHSRIIAEKLNILAQNTYPSYQQNGSVKIISSPPLVRVYFSSLIYDEKIDNGLLGYFKSAITITHNLEKGVFSRLEGHETYAKSYSLSFTMNVLHEYTPGFSEENGAIANPINILKYKGK
jgi:hypothetical protein